MTQTDDIINGCNPRQTRTPAYNTGLAKVAVQCSADTFVVNQSLVLRINICGENRHLRQARKRYRQPNIKDKKNDIFRISRKSFKRRKTTADR